MWKTIIEIKIAIQCKKGKIATTLGCAHTRRAGGYKHATRHKEKGLRSESVLSLTVT